MGLITKSIKGTLDVTPAEVGKFRHIEQTCFETARLYGFRELRTPAIEYTELFERGVGGTTDVVQKEMYTFQDKGGRSITLRPELTAGAVRAAVEQGLVFDALPVKACYVGSCYRSENPQAGRYREFHQFGVECYGAAAPQADAEVIALGVSALEELGLRNVALEINSIGCPTCRAEYNKKLREYYAPHIGEICETCKGRLERNPMRLLDCKADCCKEIAKNAPRILDCLCDECAEHFEQVKSCLDAMEIDYTVNPSIVRGLDYYTRTVFEFVSGDIGAQAAVGGGGRYDLLFSLLGGPDMPAVGFAMGIERIKLVMEAQGTEFPADQSSDIYLAPMGSNAALKCMALCNSLRKEGFAAETDLSGRSVKAQMKYADKRGFKFTCVIGDSELESGSARVKNMETGEQTEVSIDTGILELLYDTGIQNTLAGIDSISETLSGLEGLEGLAALLGMDSGEDEE